MAGPPEVRSAPSQNGAEAVLEVPAGLTRINVDTSNGSDHCKDDTAPNVKVTPVRLPVSYRQSSSELEK